MVRMLLITVSLSVVGVSMAGDLAAETWRVPAEVATIRAAVEDSASHGDTILVAPGVYDISSGEIFPITMKNGLVLTSEAGPSETIIDAQMTDRVISCSDLDSTTTIAGFTITGGQAANAGGIHCSDSFLEIRGNIVTENMATGTVGKGGGIYCAGGAPRICSNDIVGNTAIHYMGGGIYCTGSSALIEGNTISRNTARFGGGVFNHSASPTIRNNIVESNQATQTGAGLDCYMGSSPLIQGNVVVGNYAQANGAGIACCDGSAPLVTHNTIVGNVSTYGGGIRALGGSSPTVRANIIVDNVDAVYLTSDSGPITAAENHIYCNTYQTGDYEVINNTSHHIDLGDNFWWVTDALSVATLIQGGSTFLPFLTAPCDSVPGEPAAVTSVLAMEDSTYARPLADAVSIGDVLYIQLEGSDWNNSFIEPALVVIESHKDHQGICAALMETGAATGVYRGVAYLSSASSDQANEIAAYPSDTLVIWSHASSHCRDTVFVSATDVWEDELDSGPLPASFLLRQNHPNPFNRGTKIEYQIPFSALTSLQIYNVSGQVVRTLLREMQNAGDYSIHWDGRDLRGREVASGVYFCRLQAEDHVVTRKMVLIR